MNLTLVRHCYLRHGTIGTLHAGTLRLATLEEPWIRDPDGVGGQRRDGTLPGSCVPDGPYSLVPHDGAKFRDVWALVNSRLGVYRTPAQVPKDQKFGRSAILIHTGNSLADIEGCIAVGQRYGIEGNRLWLYDSRKAIQQLRDLLGGATHLLTIRPTAGTSEAIA